MGERCVPPLPARTLGLRGFGGLCRGSRLGVKVVLLFIPCASVLVPATGVLTSGVAVAAVVAFASGLAVVTVTPVLPVMGVSLSSWWPVRWSWLGRRSAERRR